MKPIFSEQLGVFIQHSGLPLRRLAAGSGIPHQTLFNWLKGSQPRWHPGLSEDIQRLGEALGLMQDETAQLLQGALQGAGNGSNHPDTHDQQEASMGDLLRIPKRWFDTGDGNGCYEIGVDETLIDAKKACVTIRAKPDIQELSEFGGLAQTIKAEGYRGKRLRFSALLRSEAVENRTAMFMRVSKAGGKITAFDNMRERFICGTTDWTRHAIVLDVAGDAEEIIYGLLLSQHGQVWMSDVQVEAVGSDVASTDLWADIEAYFPSNLDFSE